jgi:hypothetical protein
MMTNKSRYTTTMNDNRSTVRDEREQLLSHHEQSITSAPRSNKNSSSSSSSSSFSVKKVLSIGAIGSISMALFAISTNDRTTKGVRKQFAKVGYIEQPWPLSSSSSSTQNAWDLRNSESSRMENEGGLGATYNYNDFVGRLGQNGKRMLTMTTACAPKQMIEQLPFHVGDNWKYIGAKLITRSMSEEFEFAKAKEMRMTKCGSFEVEIPDNMKKDEHFGFYLYPKPRTVVDENDDKVMSPLGGSTTTLITNDDIEKFRIVSDLACENVSPHEEDKCPISRKGIITKSDVDSMHKCTGQFTHGVSDKTGGVQNVFYNRVFDGKSLSYVWGSCAWNCETEPHRSPVALGCSKPDMFAVNAKFSITGNGMTAEKLLANERDNNSLKYSIARIVNCEPNQVILKSLIDVETTAEMEEAMLGEMKTSQDDGFNDISKFAQRVAKLENQHSEVYKQNQQLTKLNVELAENKKALEDKISNWKAENEKLRNAIAQRQMLLSSNNDDNKEESLESVEKKIAKSKTINEVEVEFEILVEDEDAKTARDILDSLMKTAPKRMLDVLNYSHGINLLEKVKYLAAPKVRKVSEVEKLISLESVPLLKKTEEQQSRERKQIENANDQVNALKTASKVSEIEAKTEMSNEIETAREIVDFEKISAANAFREAFRAKELVTSATGEIERRALEENAEILEERAVHAQKEADVAQEILNEETVKMSTTSESSSSATSAESELGTSKIVASCAKPTHGVQASVTISGVGITSAKQISTHPEFGESFLKTLATLSGISDDQVKWLDLSTRARNVDESKSSRLGAWFNTVSLGSFISDSTNEEPVEVKFSLLACSQKEAEDLRERLYNVTPQHMLQSAQSFGAAIDDVQFTQPPKAETLQNGFIESYKGPTIEGKESSPIVSKAAIFEDGSLKNELSNIQRDSLRSIQRSQQQE